MSTPTRPVNIAGRRVASGISTPIGTPDLRALRAQYHGGTSPPNNIPPRLGSAQPTRGPSPSLIALPSGSSPAPRIPQYGTPDNDAIARELEALPDEEKAKVLRKHLVSKDERLNPPGGSPRTGSDPEILQGSRNASRKSSIGGLRGRREDTEPFPVPYQAPGADVT
jgi:solute carrier family 36 (proton-coupled amino acid transporter)